MKIKNSFSTFLEQALALNQNNLETIDKIATAMSSSEDTVKLTLVDPKDTNNNVEFYIPSFAYLKNEISRLSKSLETMSNVTNGAGSRIRLSDGSYRKIIASKVPSEAPTITKVNNITNFSFKSNWFFEDMLNPCLYVTWDFSNQISFDTERVMIQRYILKCDSQTKIDAFNKELNGRNDIDYKDFLNFILKYKIKYNLDDEIKDLPPRSKRYFGTFSVIKIETEKNAYGNNVKRYTLNSLEFTDTRSGFENTRILSVGDFVEINTNPVTTRFQVNYVDVSENKIGLKCVEGCEHISIGANTLKISSNQDTIVSADIPIGFDERQVVFVKPIDPDSNIPANKWSPGVAFYTNELSYVNSNGDSQTLQSFYQKNVVDFGQVLLSYAVDYYPTIKEGIKPDAPVLNYTNGDGDFKIVQINKQLTEIVNSEDFRNLISDKSRIQGELNNINDEIAKQKEVIQTTQFTSTNEKIKAQSTLESLIQQQSILTTNYNSVVNSIKAKYSSGNDVTPKYRVRGFWNIPESKISLSSGEQKIIKFRIRYRYLSESGNTNKEEEFEYKSGSANVKGRFSNWNEIETKRRPRVYTNNGWEWARIDTSDPDEVNINQLDIPIQSGEQVEIQVKSISEAGYPANPMESDWSNSIIVSFSDFSELQADDVKGLISQNAVDAAVANVSNMFRGATAHMSSSFYTNDKYFAHTAEEITSGFLSQEQTPITLYDKLYELHNKITAIIEQINGINGDINVVLVDTSDEEKIHTLNEGGTTYVYAGDYLSSISKLDSESKKGAIVTKTFYVDISTTAQSGLYLLSKLSGDRLTMCPSTVRTQNGVYIDANTDFGDEYYRYNDYLNYDNIINPSTTSSPYYFEQGRYDLVPINLTNPEFIDFQIGSPNMYQSAQCKGQFIYSRFRNIGDTFDMYANKLGAIDGCGVYTYDADFIESEIFYNCHDDYYIGGDKNKTILDEYNRITGSSLESINEEDAKKILNRLPKTWKKKDSASLNLLSNKKILLRTQSINKKPIEPSTESGPAKLMARMARAASYNKPTVLKSQSKANPTVITSNTGIAIGGSTVGGSTGSGSIWEEHDWSSIITPGTTPPGSSSGSTSGSTTSGASDTIRLDIERTDSDKFVYKFTVYKNGIKIYGDGSSAYIIISKEDNGKVTEIEKKYIVGYESVVVDFANNSNKNYGNGKYGVIAVVESNNSKLNSKLSVFEINLDLKTETSVRVIKNEIIQSNLEKLQKRLSGLSTLNGSVYTIIPKIQAAYGFADMGVDLDGSESDDDGSYVTTHKIGYEDKDRFAIGKETCNSYLFMSPVNHSEIQVEGDSYGSTKFLKDGESLRVPIIYQFRMEDYNGDIFGDSSNKASDSIVKNTKFANIIGLDIWVNQNDIKPKQYDIIVYSTYDSTIEVNTGKTKVSTQSLNNAGKEIANKLDKLIKDNRSLATNTLITKDTNKITRIKH